MAIFLTAPIENRDKQIKRLTVQVSNEGTDPMSVLLEVLHAPQPNDGPSASVMYVQQQVNLDPGTVQTFNNIFADLPVVHARVTTSGAGADLASVSFTAKDANGSVVPGAINPIQARPDLQGSSFFTGPIDNEQGIIRSLVVRASNEGTEPANVLLEAFYPTQPAVEGPSAKVLYVQSLVSLDPGTIQTFDTIFADFPILNARITASGAGANSVASSFAARTADGRFLRAMPSVSPPPRAIPVGPIPQGIRQVPSQAIQPIPPQAIQPVPPQSGGMPIAANQIQSL